MGRGRGRDGSGQGGGGARGGGRVPGLMGGPSVAGPGGDCVCPSCGHREPHVVGEPCYRKKCPQCGTQMARE